MTVWSKFRSTKKENAALVYSY